MSPTSELFERRAAALLRLAAVEFGADKDDFHDFIQAHLLQVIAASTARLGAPRSLVLVENAVRLAGALAEAEA